MRNFITYDKLYTLNAAQQRQRCDFANTYMISNRMLAIVSIPKSHAGLVAFPLNWHKPCQWGISTSLIFYNLLEILSSILIKYRYRHEFIIKPLCFFLFVNICVLKGGMAIFFLYLLNREGIFASLSWHTKNHYFLQWYPTLQSWILKFYSMRRLRSKASHPVTRWLARIFITKRVWFVKSYK